MGVSVGPDRVGRRHRPDQQGQEHHPRAGDTGPDGSRRPRPHPRPKTPLKEAPRCGGGKAPDEESRRPTCLVESPWRPGRRSFSGFRLSPVRAVLCVLGVVWVPALPFAACRGVARADLSRRSPKDEAGSRVPQSAPLRPWRTLRLNHARTTRYVFKGVPFSNARFFRPQTNPARRPVRRSLTGAGGSLGEGGLRASEGSYAHKGMHMAWMERVRNRAPKAAKTGQKPRKKSKKALNSR